MKKKWPVIQGCLVAGAMAILILDSKTALAGAQKGVALCIQTVIPSLFPFFILSILLTGTAVGRKIRFLAPLCRLFRIPKGAEGLLAAGFLGGYPVGAQCVSQAFESGHLSGSDARRMLVICNNCGPAFLFGMAAAVFHAWYTPWLLWAIQIISSLVVAQILPATPHSIQAKGTTRLTLIEALNRSLQVMGSVCGWVILFRVVIAFLDGWALWLLPLESQVGISGLMELSNGCHELYRIDNTGLRFVLCAGMLNFGGICVMLQTAAVTDVRIDRSLYFPGKVLQGCISMILAWFLQIFFVPLPQWRHTLLFVGTVTTFFITIAGFIRVKMKNCSSIPDSVGV